MDVNVGFLASESWEPQAMQARTQWLRTYNNAFTAI